MQVTSIMEQLLFSTVRITTVNQSGNHGLGTGFVYSAPTPSGLALFVVTNKHVVEGAAAVTLHFIAGSSGQPQLGKESSITLLPGTLFVGHPDSEIDVAALPLGGIADELIRSGNEPFFRAVGAELAATPEALEAFEPIEPVTFVGYPDGLYDANSLMPIARRGHSATALNVDYEGQPMFLIDASVFPGSSGSPVFLVVPASTPDKLGNITIGGGTKCLFLGVVAAVYQRSVPVLQTSTGSSFVYDALDIGIVYKASTIVELTNQMIAAIKPSPTPPAG